tara:strand:+ start:1617 stop:2222 length:606 start_codon:yes stop_codon:yes gene_type:complete
MIELNSHSWPFKIDEIHDFAYVENFLSKEECEEIIKIGNNKRINEATVFGKDNLSVQRNIRKSKVAWLGNRDLPKLYPKLTDTIMALNEKFFKFDLHGFEEGIQFTIYDGKGAKYGKHVDRGLDMKVRKLSITIELSDPSKRKGGDLRLITGDPDWTGKNRLPKNQGTLIAFPSWTLHEVEPIVKGTRYSLVAWITGKNFK